MIEEGLRERSKARRRVAIIRAAFRLFAERGYDATTVADIADAAEVAPRTVTLYFRSKQDIALCKFSEAADQLTDLLRNRCSGETVTEIMGRWMCDKPPGTEDDDLKELDRRMFQANPELRALRAVRMAPAIREGTRAIAEDTNSSPDDIGPRIAAAAAAAIMIELADNPPATDQEQAVATALAFLDAGIRTL